MQIIVKLEQKDFSGNKAVFDQLYALSDVLNKPQEIQQGETIPKNEVERKADIPPAYRSVTQPEVPVQPPVHRQIPISQPAQIPPTQSAPPVNTNITYDLAQVSQAAAAFAETSDECRNNVLDAIRAQGVNALTEMSSDQLGAFVTNLRGLGARI